MQIKYIATLLGVFLGMIIFADLPAIVLLGFLGYILFDYKKVVPAKPDIPQEDPFINDNSSEVFLYINNIIQIGVAILNLKGNILYSELTVMKTFLQNDMDIDEKDITEVNNIIEHTIQIKDAINVDNAVNLVNQYCRYQEKLNILHLLFVLAIADSEITPTELDFISKVAQGLNIQSEHFVKLKNIYCVKDFYAYKILGISTDATVPEIKKTYRKLAMQYHPDKIECSSEEEKKAQTDKFQEIVAAYKIALSEAEKNG